MSNEPKRIFSLSGHLTSPRRSRLKPDIIKASECVGNWERKGFIKMGDHKLRDEGREQQLDDERDEDVGRDPDETKDDDAEEDHEEDHEDSSSEDDDLN